MRWVHSPTGMPICTCAEGQAASSFMQDALSLVPDEECKTTMILNALTKLPLLSDARHYF